METNEFKAKLAELIKASDLSTDQKELWYLFMIKSLPEEDEAVYEAVSESVDNLELLTKHLRDKIFTMAKLTDEEWHKITSGEMDYGEELSGENKHEK